MKTIDAKISTDCEEVKLVDVVQHSQREQLIEGLRSSMKFIREREELKGIEHGAINFRNELKVELTQCGKLFKCTEKVHALSNESNFE